MNKNLIIFLILVFNVWYIGDASAAVYHSYVDQDYGFYRVIILSENLTTVAKPIIYANKTLNITVGDTVVWINDATPDEELNIISDQGLWNGTAQLRWNFQMFNYTFNTSGIYTFHIKEYPRLQHQTINVNSNLSETPVPIITVIAVQTQGIVITPKNTPIINNTILPTSTKKSSGFSGFDAFLSIITILLMIYRYRYNKIKN